MAETKKKTTKKATPAVNPISKRGVHQLDASGQTVGRLASQVSILLRGKDRADFIRHIDVGNTVVVKNAGQMKFSGKKFDQKVYHHHTMYPGGLKTTKLRDVFEKNPSEVLRKAVWNMLPKNRTRPKVMKRLIISN
jgi:large subunit ribosomal protein L13